MRILKKASALRRIRLGQRLGMKIAPSTVVWTFPIFVNTFFFFNEKNFGLK